MTEQDCSSRIRERVAILPRERWQKLRVKELCQGVCNGECSRWVGEAECVSVSEYMGVGGRVCKGWDFPGLLTLEPRDAHPFGDRRSPAPLAPRMNFIVFTQKETPSFPERKLF